jgi:hypothetical protein
MWRARIEPGRALLTQLTALDTADPGAIVVTRQPGIPWPKVYGAIGEQPTKVLDGLYDLFEMPGDPVEGSGGVVFVRKAGARGSDDG